MGAQAISTQPDSVCATVSSLQDTTPAMGGPGKVVMKSGNTCWYWQTVEAGTWDVTISGDRHEQSFEFGTAASNPDVGCISPFGWDVSYLAMNGVMWSKISSPNGTVTLTYRKRDSSEADVWKIQLKEGSSKGVTPNKQ